MAKQQERTAEAEKALIELQQKVKGRTVTADQMERFKAVTAGSSKGAVQIRVQDGDPEAIAFAVALSMMLSNAGWTVGRIQPMMFVGPGAIGLSLTIDSIKPLAPPSKPNEYGFPADSLVLYGAVLHNALNEIGIPVSQLWVHSGIEVKANGVSIGIGHKP